MASDAEPALGVVRLAAAALPFGRMSVAKGSVVDFTGAAIVNAANEGCLGGGGVDGCARSTTSA